MPQIRTEINLNHAAIAQMLKSPGGMVGRFIYRLGLDFVLEAKLRSPVKTGAMLRSITITSWPGPMLSLEAGANIEYGQSVTFGQPGREVVPKRKKALRFPDKAGVMIFAAKSNPGPSKPNPFLWDSLVAVVRRAS